MKKLYILMPFALITLACNSSNDDEPSTTEETPILVTKLTNEDGIVTFKYDGVKLLETNTDDGERTTYSYTGNLITQTKEYENGILAETSDFTYDANNKIALIKSVGTTIGSNTSNTHTYTFEYPNSSTVICTDIRNYTFSGSPQVTKDIMTYTFSDENIVLVKSTYYYNNTLSGNITTNYSYDDKKNPFINILGFDKLKVYLSESHDDNLSGKNNLVSYKQVNTPVSSSTTTYRTDYTLTYNDKNYPINILNKSYNTSNELVHTGVTVYTYNQ